VRAIASATAASYTLTPDDIGTTVSLVITATGKGGAQSATAPTTAVIAAAPVPAAVVGTLVAPQGGAGAVVTDDARATVTWQPGAITPGATVTLTHVDPLLAVAATGVSLDAGTALNPSRGPWTSRTPPPRSAGSSASRPTDASGFRSRR
jgi:hypothetical protein